jgi:hypothetical protein
LQPCFDRLAVGTTSMTAWARTRRSGDALGCWPVQSRGYDRTTPSPLKRAAMSAAPRLNRCARPFGVQEVGSSSLSRPAVEYRTWQYDF